MHETGRTFIDNDHPPLEVATLHIVIRSASIAVFKTFRTILALKATESINPKFPFIWSIRQTRARWRLLFTPKPSQNARPESQFMELAMNLNRPAPPHTVEFHIGSTEAGESFARICETFRAHKAKVIAHYGHLTNKESVTFVESFVVDTSSMDCQVDDLLIHLRKLKLVRWAEKSKMSGKVFSNFFFKVTLGNRRSIIFDTDALSSLFDSLKTSHADISSTIRDEARKLGLAVATAIPGANAGALDSQPALVIDWVIGFLQTSGWGIFSFGKSDGVYTLKLSDPPISEYGGTQTGIQAYLCGIVLGLIEGATRTKMDILNVYYNKEDRMLSIFAGEMNVTESRAVHEIVPVVPSLSHEKLEAPMKETPLSKAPVSPELPTDTAAAPDPKFSELTIRVLAAAKKPTQKVRIMHSARINFSEANKMIENLVNSGLLEAKEPDEFGVTSYETTKKGLQMIGEETGPEIESF